MIRATRQVTTFDTSTTGLIKITFTASTGIVLVPGGSQTFISLHMAVPSAATYASKEILDLQNIAINNGTSRAVVTGIDDAAVHVSGFLGDSDGTRPMAVRTRWTSPAWRSALVRASRHGYWSTR